MTRRTFSQALLTLNLCRIIMIFRNRRSVYSTIYAPTIWKLNQERNNENEAADPNELIFNSSRANMHKN